MRKLPIIILVLFLLFTCDLQAQRRKKVVKVKQPEPEVAEETPQEKLFKSMVVNTAKVMFIDSLVVDKNNFLNYIPLSTEAGMIIPYNELFDKDGQEHSFVYANEFGTTCYYSELLNDTTRYLYSIDKLGKTQLSNDIYWTAIQCSETGAYGLLLANGVAYIIDKNASCKVRPMITYYANELNLYIY